MGTIGICRPRSAIIDSAGSAPSSKRCSAPPLTKEIGVFDEEPLALTLNRGVDLDGEVRTRRFDRLRPTVLYIA